MLNLNNFVYLLQNKRQNKTPKKEKFEVARNSKKKKPSELVVDLSLDGHGHEQRLILVRLRGIVFENS